MADLVDRELLGAAARRTMRWNFRLWGFGESIALRGILAAYEVLDDREFLGFVQGVMRSWMRGPAGLRFEDHVAPGFELLELHRLTGWETIPRSCHHQESDPRGNS